MKLELAQLTRAREICATEKRTLEQEVRGTETHLRELRATAQRIREYGERAVTLSKTRLAELSRQLQMAEAELERLEGEFAHLCESEESVPPLEAPEQGQDSGNAGGNRQEEGALLQAEKRELSENIERQRQHISRLSRDIEQARKDFHALEKETRENDMRARQHVEEGERVLPKTLRCFEEAAQRLRQIERAFDQAEKLLRQYERSGDA